MRTLTAGDVLDSRLRGNDKLRRLGSCVHVVVGNEANLARVIQIQLDAQIQGCARRLPRRRPPSLATCDLRQVCGCDRSPVWNGTALTAEASAACGVGSNPAGRLRRAASGFRRNDARRQFIEVIDRTETTAPVHERLQFDEVIGCIATQAPVSTGACYRIRDQARWSTPPTGLGLFPVSAW